MIEWGRVPWTLWVYAVVSLGSAGLRLLLAANHPHVGVLVFFVVVMLAWLFFLFKGIRWLWIGTLVVLFLSSLSIVIFGPRTLLGALSGLADFALLLAPPTRRYFAKSEPLADT